MDAPIVSDRPLSSPPAALPAQAAGWGTARAVLVAGALVLCVAHGTRHAFGLFLQPVSLANGWGRETFALAIALQNLVWGVAQPFAGMVSDRIGAGRVIIVGALLYATGLVLMTLPLGTCAFMLSAGVLIGLGQSGTTFPIIFGAIGRIVPASRRSLAMGIAMAAGSFGQFIMLPAALLGMNALGWQRALLAFALAAGAMAALAPPLLERDLRRRTATAAPPAAGAAFRSAVAHRGFLLLSLGFFVCGFQVVFIAVHLPAFIVDRGLPAHVPTLVLALIGLFNIAGTYLAGLWGGRRSKPRLLVWIYLARAAAMTGFVWLPVTIPSACVFAALMGLLWLSTAPLTNGTIATMFGVRNLSMLGGVAFFMHQLGGFLGGWLGGLIYDRLGSYDVAWAIAIGLSLVAALVTWPIEEKPVACEAGAP